MQIETPTDTKEILLLEQSASELDVIQEAADCHHVSVVTECPDIVSFLLRQGRYDAVPRPDLIILDLDLSRTEDCEVLSDIKKSPDFKRIPVVVLASSERYEHVMEAYNLHANAYIVKPSNRQDFCKVLRATLFFWLSLVRLPRG